MNDFAVSLGIIRLGGFHPENSYHLIAKIDKLFQLPVFLEFIGLGQLSHSPDGLQLRDPFGQSGEVDEVELVIDLIHFRYPSPASSALRPYSAMVCKRD
jgi:hypothetical protein